MGDQERARTKLAATLTSVQRYGVVALVLGAVGAVTIVDGFGVGVAILGIVMIVGAAFGKGYYLG